MISLSTIHIYSDNLHIDYKLFYHIHNSINNASNSITFQYPYIERKYREEKILEKNVVKCLNIQIYLDYLMLYDNSEIKNILYDNYKNKIEYLKKLNEDLHP